jgi:hypothetical protein
MKTTSTTPQPEVDVATRRASHHTRRIPQARQWTDEAESLDAHEIHVSHQAARSLALDFPKDNLTDRPVG